MMKGSRSSLLLAVVALVAALAATTASAFTVPPGVSRRSCSRFPLNVAADNKVEEDIQIVWEDDDDDNEEPAAPSEATRKKRRRRWEQLDPKYRQYLIEKGQQRAMENKKKNEPAQTKKRKLLLFVREQQRRKKKAARIQRRFSERIPLDDVQVGAEVMGTVISLTNFGAYVDIGTTVDGLLHVSQLSSEVFVEHPRQVLTPGQEVTVRVRSTNPARGKMHLTMLPLEVLEEERRDAEQASDRIALEELQLDEELWGQLKRVTDFGAYVEVGAIVDGWLHFMDHPSWDGKMHPSDFMTRGDRVRVWVSDIDHKQNRLKLTAHRPAHLPGPRREF